MKKSRRRSAAWAALALCAGVLAFLASGCGGDGGGGGGTAIEGLGGSIEEIQEKAREEGKVNLVIWPAYTALAKEFTQATGCQVNSKDAGTGDDMIDLLSTGEYDGVSASGHTSVRLMEKGDVVPIDPDLIPNYADINEGIKGKDYNSKDGEPYGVPHGRGPNLLVFRTDVLPEDTDSWAVVWDQAGPYKGKLSIYDDNIFIADAALYLKATRPELGIDNPYQLTREQFDAAVALLKEQAPNVGEYWVDPAKQVQSFTNKNSVVGTTWPYQVNLLNQDDQPVKAIKPKEGTTGWSDTWMIYSKAENPNCMYLWMNHIASPEAQAAVAEGFGEAPVNPKACELTKNPNHCEDFHADDEAWWEDVYYWTTPTADCGGAGGECVTQAEWKAAWTEIRG